MSYLPTWIVNLYGVYKFVGKYTRSSHASDIGISLQLRVWSPIDTFYKMGPPKKIIMNRVTQWIAPINGRKQMAFTEVMSPFQWSYFDSSHKKNKWRKNTWIIGAISYKPILMRPRTPIFYSWFLGTNLFPFRFLPTKTLSALTAATPASASHRMIFHQPRFPWNKAIFLTKPPFGVRACEVAIIWPDKWLITMVSFRP